MKEHTLFIDSRNAHIKKSNIDFAILLNGDDMYPGDAYKNVVSVELTAMTITNVDPLKNEPYIVLDIAELNNRVYSNVPIAHQCFAIILIDHSSTTNTQMIRGTDFDEKIVTFDTPLSTLSRLSIKITGKSIPIDYDGYFTMIFKIKTLM